MGVCATLLSGRLESMSAYKERRDKRDQGRGPGRRGTLCSPQLSLHFSQGISPDVIWGRPLCDSDSHSYSRD